MFPRGGGGWFGGNLGLASWFGNGGVGGNGGGGGGSGVASRNGDEGKGAINFGVWIEGRPSKEGFIIAFQTGNPDKDARISANWMACGR